MNCSKCGAQNIDGVTFCGSCGTPMKSFIPPPPPETPQQSQQNEGVYGQPPPPNYQQQSYSGGQSYNTQGSSYSSHEGAPYSGGMVPPNNYMVASIIVTIISTLCCCSPISIIIGIIAIIKANSVNTEFERGNIEQANRNSESAKKLTIWAAVITVVFFVIMQIISALIIIPSMGGLEEILTNMNSYN